MRLDTVAARPSAAAPPLYFWSSSDETTRKSVLPLVIPSLPGRSFRQEPSLHCVGTLLSNCAKAALNLIHKPAILNNLLLKLPSSPRGLSLRWLFSRFPQTYALCISAAEAHCDCGAEECTNPSLSHTTSLDSMAEPSSTAAEELLFKTCEATWFEKACISLRSRGSWSTESCPKQKSNADSHFRIVSVMRKGKNPRPFCSDSSSLGIQPPSGPKATTAEGRLDASCGAESEEALN